MMDETSETEAASAETSVEISARRGNPFAQPKYNRKQRRGMAAAQRGARWVRILRAATKAATKKAMRSAMQQAEKVAAETLALDAEEALD